MKPAHSISTYLLASTALASCAMLFSALPALAQGQPAAAAPETVEVTGTIIRGAVPTGSNVITVDRRAIEATGAVTIQNVLSDVPGLNNFGGAGQGGVNSSDPAGAQSPTIHNLGNSASNGTLILVDGHRLPYTGNGHSTIDPSSVPVIALQQVQVLADGASSTYGSDAVAGVLNFITRKDFTGMEFSAQYGAADHYSSFNGGALFGHAWDGGSALVALDYSSKSELANGVRSYETPRQDLRLGATTASWATPLPVAPGTGCPVGGVAVIAGTCIATTTPPSGEGTTDNFAVTVPAPSLGSNFDNFTCPIATIKASSSATASYLYPYSLSTGVQNNVTSFNGVCSNANVGTDLPSETRNTIFTSFKQNITNDLTASLDFDYSFREDGSHSSFGTLSSIAAFGPTSGKGAPAPGTAFSALTGAPVTTTTTTTNPSCITLAVGCGQINPFFVGNTATGTSTESISFDPGPLLLANGFRLPLSKTFDETAYGTFGLTYAVGGDWEIVLGTTFGTDMSGQRQSGNFCTGCAELALNGTTNSTGTPATSVGTTAQVDPNGLATVTAQNRSLTTLNALDVWDPIASNKTSAAVLKQIASAYSLATGEQSIQDVTLKTDGTVFDLPAGPVKLAVGGEYTHNTMVAEFANASNTVAAAPFAATFNAIFGRTVWAGYAEILAPLVSPEMNIPLVEKFDLDVSGRVDDYTFYGDTENPKIGFTWGIFEGLSGRGSFGTSFTVPAFNSGGINGTGITSQSNASSTNTVPVPTNATANTVLFNDPRYNGGAGTAGTWIATAAGCAAAGSNPVNAAGTTVLATDPTAVACKVNNSGSTPGLSIGGGGGDPGGGIKPEVGRSYSAGFDFDIGKMLGVLDGLTGQVTYYQATYKGLITNINITTSNLGFTHFAPPGGWASTDPTVIKALGAEPLNSTIPQTVWFYTLGGQNNAYNLWVNGLDYGAHYNFDSDVGSWRLGLSGNEILRFTQQNIGQTALFTDMNGDAGSSGRFSAQQMTVRATVDWSMDAFRAGLGFNFQSAYKAAVSAFPYNLATNPMGAGLQHVHPLETIDLNLGYTIPDTWLKGLGGTQVTLTVTNLLDTNPPFFDNSSGFTSGSEIGRIVTVALKQNF